MNHFVRPRPIDNPAIRLVVFHHAGGSAIAYYPLVHGIPVDWDLLLIDMPGRGRRHRSPALTDMESLADVATQDVLAWTTAPIALFGHSLGALVAVEVARRLQVRGLAPIWVGVSGRPWPGHDVEDVEHDLQSTVSDEQLMRVLSAGGGIPDRIDEVPQFRDRFLQVVRSDLRAVESYRPDPAREPLDVPLAAFAGDSDHLAPPAAVAAWVRETRAGFQVRFFSGGHFYFLGPMFSSLTAALTQEIERVRQQMPLSGPALSQATA
jgi:surfactin synthase thioesterase subunit